jgi:hypothetical protein
VYITYLGIAIAIPVIKPVISPREPISSVGHSSAIGENDDAKPMTAPTKTAINKAPSSLRADDLVRDQSTTRLPKVIPMTGPMMGDTNILATIITVESVMSPMPAKIEAMTKSAKKSKLNSYCKSKRWWKHRCAYMDIINYDLLLVPEFVPLLVRFSSDWRHFSTRSLQLPN